MVVADSSPKRRGRFGRILGMVLVLVVVIAALWTWFALSWSYSEGERAGILQKFSKKGWVCKTYEGELALYVVGGVAPQIWYFSTRDDKLAQQLSAAVGDHIRLHYTEHRGVPTACFAETPYFAESFTRVQR
jgi:mannose/fructose/N-acetylgalactosamine-specific phosphotransferase system component IID